MSGTERTGRHASRGKQAPERRPLPSRGSGGPSRGAEVDQLAGNATAAGNMNRQRLGPVIGIVGGVASGKSLVSRCFEKLGALRVDADRIGHQVLDRPDVQQQLRLRWGDEVFQADGRVDRGQVARRVFAADASGEADLDFLEALTHPMIAQEISRQLAEQRDAHPVAVLDAAVMHKAGWHRFCQYTVFVDAPMPLRQQRAALRGWSASDWQAREQAQGDLDLRRRQADFIVVKQGEIHIAELQKMSMAQLIEEARRRTWPTWPG
jgi:dephospho-CoA kinase